MDTNDDYTASDSTTSIIGRERWARRVDGAAASLLGLAFAAFLIAILPLSNTQIAAVSTDDVMHRLFHTPPGPPPAAAKDDADARKSLRENGMRRSASAADAAKGIGVDDDAAGTAASALLPAYPAGGRTLYPFRFEGDMAAAAENNTPSLLAADGSITGAASAAAGSPSTGSGMDAATLTATGGLGGLTDALNAILLAAHPTHGTGRSAAEGDHLGRMMVVSEDTLMSRDRQRSLFQAAAAPVPETSSSTFAVVSVSVVGALMMRTRCRGRNARV